MDPPAQVLVVDDDPAILFLLRRWLSGWGHRVSEAHHGAEALERMAEQPPELVVTDLSMPAMSGLDLLREARARGSAAEFVFVTAVGSVPSAVEAIKLGAFEFLEKPVRSERLRQVVDLALRRRRGKVWSVAPDSVLEEAELAPTPVPATPAVGPIDVHGGLPAPPAPRAGPAGTLPPPLPPATGAGPAARIGRYDVLEMVGRGGMGEVYRCRDPLIGRVVAVKMLRAWARRTEHADEMLARFQREAAAVGRLSHPGVVHVHDLGRDEALSAWFIVFEFVEGRSLDRLIAGLGRLGPSDALRVGFQLADALAHAHSRGVVHRDVKPPNVMVRPDGTCKLLDFGLAGLWGSEITLPGRLFGSPSYMAPERVRGEPAGPAADQFALGVVLYEALAGTNPFAGDNPEARLRRVLDEHPVRLDRLRPDVPAPLASLVDRMLAKRLGDRLASLDAAALELGRTAAALGIHLERHLGQAGLD